MKPAMKLEGTRVGRLTVIERLHPNDRRGNTRWLCRCDCGAEIESVGVRLNAGRTLSCGCLRHEQAMKAVITHGKSRTRVYKIWFYMKRRCADPRNKNYNRYGGRGITVCDRWMKFENFYADMGDPTDGETIDRIDNDGPYSPDNCRWADRRTQRRNNSQNIIVQVNGKDITLADACDALGANHQRIYTRMRRGMSFQEAIEYGS